MNTTAFGAALHIENGPTFADRWWVIALRGVFAIAFGLVAFFWPGITMLSLVLVFAAYSLVDGAMWTYAAMTNARNGLPWKLALFNGLLDIVIGILAVIWPAITVAAFVLLVAAWSLVTGWLMLVAALRSRRRARGRGWRIFGGIVSIVFAVLLIVAPFVGALVLTWWIGSWALVFGVVLIMLAFQLRGAHDNAGQGATTARS
jgi:uncharacterized membrane protein HdeD (DUF308 family)